MSFSMHDSHVTSNFQAEAALMPEVVLPGFRFHPTDEELVGFYLHRKVEHKPLPFEVITQLDIYKYDPWDLPRMAVPGDNVWYFFCLRDQKYRNSTRPNRVGKGGFWKATGPDRAIYTLDGSKCIGLKKSLVFYRGKAAKGTKTDWVMHEFRLPVFSSTKGSKKRDCTSAFEESWAVCRIFKKRSMTRRGVSPNSWASLADDAVLEEPGAAFPDGVSLMQQQQQQQQQQQLQLQQHSQQFSRFAFPPLNNEMDESNKQLSNCSLSFLSTLTSDEVESPPSTLSSSSAWDLAALMELTGHSM